MFKSSPKRIEDLRDRIKEILTACDVPDTRDKIAVAKCLQGYFLGKYKHICRTCGKILSTRVGYMYDPTGWESLIPPEELLSWKHRFGDCNNHHHTLASIFESTGIPYRYLFIAGRYRIRKGKLEPMWTHITIGIRMDKYGGVIPFETISPYRFGHLCKHHAVAVYDPRSREMTLRLHQRWAKLLGWTKREMPFQMKHMKLPRIDRRKVTVTTNPTIPGNIWHIIESPVKWVSPGG